MNAYSRPSVLPTSAKQPAKALMPPLTSLVDMMTILLVFLLKSFSAEGALFTPSDDLTIPESAARKKAQPALMIEVSQKAVMVDGRLVVTIDEVVRNDSLVVKPLYDWLSGVASLSTSNKQEREVIIQCDKTCDFKILKKVMATCARASWSDFSLLVLQKGE